MALKSGPEIISFLKSLEQESKAITEDIITLTIYSNQNYDQMWNISPEEKEMFVRILKQKINLDKGIKEKDTFFQSKL